MSNTLSLAVVALLAAVVKGEAYVPIAPNSYGVQPGQQFAAPLGNLNAPFSTPIIRPNQAFPQINAPAMPLPQSFPQGNIAPLPLPQPFPQGNFPHLPLPNTIPQNGAYAVPWGTHPPGSSGFAPPSGKSCDDGVPGECMHVSSCGGIGRSSVRNKCREDPEQICCCLPLGVNPSLFADNGLVLGTNAASSAAPVQGQAVSTHVQGPGFETLAAAPIATGWHPFSPSSKLSVLLELELELELDDDWRLYDE